MTRSAVVEDALGGLVADIEVSEFFGPAARDRVVAMASESAEAAGERLYATRSAVIGPIVVRDEAIGGPMVARPVSQLGHALNDLLGQRFMQINKDVNAVAAQLKLVTDHLGISPVPPTGATK